MLVTTPETGSWVPVGAPVAGLTKASAVRACPSTCVNRAAEPDPCRSRLKSFTTQSLPPVQTLALNGSRAPVLALMAATPRRVTPAAPGAGANVEKLPAT